MPASTKMMAVQSQFPSVQIQDTRENHMCGATYARNPSRVQLVQPHILQPSYTPIDFDGYCQHDEHQAPTSNAVREADRWFTWIWDVLIYNN